MATIRGLVFRVYKVPVVCHDVRCAVHVILDIVNVCVSEATNNESSVACKISDARSL